MSILYKTAEEFPPHVIEKIETIGFMKYYEDRNVELVKMVERNEKSFHAVYIEGLYGSGKTFLARKIGGRLANETERVIPIHLYLGSRSFKLKDLIKAFIEDVEAYVSRGESKPAVSGAKERWQNRIKVLKDSFETTQKLEGMEFLNEFSRTLNNLGYYPFYIFDEFERVLLTGEVLIARENVSEFASFSATMPAVIRGTVFQGGVAISTTARFSELISQAIESEVRRQFINDLSKMLNVDIISNPEHYPLARQPIMETFEKCLIHWDEQFLELLAQKFNLIVHTDVIKVLAKVLPTPRAVISLATALGGIYRDVHTNAIKVGEVVSLDKLASIVMPAFAKLKEQLESTTIDGKPLITAQTKWLDRFELLLRHGVIYVPTVNRDMLKKIAALLSIEAPTEEKLIRKTKEVLSNLYKLGLFERTPKEYMLDRHIFAYLLGIEKLPHGESATLKNLIDRICNNVKKRREELRRERATKREEA